LEELVKKYPRASIQFTGKTNDWSGFYNSGNNSNSNNSNNNNGTTTPIMSYFTNNTNNANSGNLNNNFNGWENFLQMRNAVFEQKINDMSYDEKKSKLYSIGKNLCCIKIVRTFFKFHDFY